MSHTYALIAGLVAALILPAAGRAQTTDSNLVGCSNELYTILERDLKITALTSLRNDGKIAAEACKPWAYKPELMLAAFEYDAGIVDEKRLAAAVINTRTRKVVSSYERSVNADSWYRVEGRSLEFDTARYQLAKDVRAFALRFYNPASNGSCVNSRSATELSLLVPDSRSLRSVLDISMHQERALVGCLGTGYGDDMVSETADLSIGIGMTSTNGFRDLIVTARIATNFGDSAKQQPPDRLERLTLRYNKRIYRSDHSYWWFGL